MTPITGERIRLARELRGLSQDELAARMGISQTVLSFMERGQGQPAPEALDQLVLATRLPRSFFRATDRHTFPLGSLLYRSRAKLKAGDRDRLRAWAQVAFHAVTVLRSRLKPIPVKLPRLPGEDPEHAAIVTRSELGLAPNTPVPNVIRAVERAGVQVFAMPFEVEGVDAFSAWVGHPPIPVIVLGRHLSGDRQRFTVGHELDHLVQHYQVDGPLKQLELEAHRFAGEFLLPAEAMQQEMTQPFTLSEAARIKQRWGVSMQMAIRRAWDLDIIKEHQYKYLMKQIAARGWKQQEPPELHIEPEQPRGFRQMAEIVFGKPIDTQAMARAIDLPESDVAWLLAAYAGRTDLPDRSPSASVLTFPGGSDKSDRNRA